MQIKLYKADEGYGRFQSLGIWLHVFDQDPLKIDLESLFTVACIKTERLDRQVRMQKKVETRRLACIILKQRRTDSITLLAEASLPFRQIGDGGPSPFSG